MTPDHCDFCTPERHCSQNTIGRGRFVFLGDSNIARRDLTPIDQCPTLLDYTEQQAVIAEDTLAGFNRFTIDDQLNDLLLGSL
jgi:hypothetical protein